MIFLTHTRLPDAPDGGRGGGFHVHPGLARAYSASAFLCDERVRLALAGDNLTAMVDTP